jgi:hypothetical protein
MLPNLLIIISRTSHLYGESPLYRHTSPAGCLTAGPQQLCDEKVGCAPPVDTKFEATFGQKALQCNPQQEELGRGLKFVYIFFPQQKYGCHMM